MIPSLSECGHESVRFALSFLKDESADIDRELDELLNDIDALEVEMDQASQAADFSGVFSFTQIDEWRRRLSEMRKREQIVGQKIEIWRRDVRRLRSRAEKNKSQHDFDQRSIGKPSRKEASCG